MILSAFISTWESFLLKAKSTEYLLLTLVLTCSRFPWKSSFSELLMLSEPMNVLNTESAAALSSLNLLQLLSEQVLSITR